jgi:hypothetical protein
MIAEEVESIQCMVEQKNGEKFVTVINNVNLVPNLWLNLFLIIKALKNGFNLGNEEDVKLIEASETIEQSKITVERPFREESSQSHRNMKRSADKNSTEPIKKKKSNSKHYCSENEYNPTHSTADRYTLKNRAKATNHAPKADKHSFSNQNLR